MATTATTTSYYPPYYRPPRHKSFAPLLPQWAWKRNDHPIDAPPHAPYASDDLSKSLAPLLPQWVSRNRKDAPDAPPPAPYVCDNLSDVVAPLLPQLASRKRKHHPFDAPPPPAYASDDLADFIAYDPSWGPEYKPRPTPVSNSIELQVVPHLVGAASAQVPPVEVMRSAASPVITSTEELCPRITQALAYVAPPAAVKLPGPSPLPVEVILPNLPCDAPPMITFTEELLPRITHALTYVAPPAAVELPAASPLPVEVKMADPPRVWRFPPVPSYANPMDPRIKRAAMDVVPPPAAEELPAPVLSEGILQLDSSAVPLPCVTEDDLFLPLAKRRKLSPPRAKSSTPSASSPMKPAAKKRGPARRGRGRARSSSVEDEDDFSPSPSRASRSVSVTLDRFDTTRIEEPIERPVCLEDCGSFEGIVTGSKVVEMIGIEQYGPYFNGPFDLKNPPKVRLEYPAEGAYEEFPLVFPKDRDDYQPITNLVMSIELMLKHFLDPQQSSWVGWRPELSMSEFIYDHPNLLPIEDERAYSNGCPTPWASIRNGLILKDLDMFLEGMGRLNRDIRCLKHEQLDLMRGNIRKMKGLHHEVVKHICEETHHRTVGPHVDRLNNYKAWTNEVYGEFLPPFITELVYRTGLTPNSKVLDLGSGTSQVLIQASLLSGCAALGVELRQEAADFGVAQCEEYKVRARMWGVDWGKGVTPLQGDFTECEEVRRWIGKADVVFCNNYAFRPALNGTLSAMFLDCKEGCKIVSLRPFRAPSFKLTRKNMDDPAARLSVEVGKYGDLDVSWAGSKGDFYIHTVDPTELREFAAKNGML